MSYRGSIYNSAIFRFSRRQEGTSVFTLMKIHVDASSKLMSGSFSVTNTSLPASLLFLSQLNALLCFSYCSKRLRAMNSEYFSCGQLISIGHKSLPTERVGLSLRTLSDVGGSDKYWKRRKE